MQGEELRTDINNLVLENMKLAHNISWSYKDCGMEIEDIHASAMVGLVKAANIFEPSRGYKFSTLAVPVIVNEIRMELRRFNKHRGCISLDSAVEISRENEEECSLLDTIPYKEDGFDRVNQCDMIPYYFENSRLTDREKQAVYLVVCKEMSQTKAQDIIGINQSVISRYVKSGIRKIRKEYMACT